MCDQHCPAGYDQEIVDIYQQPEMVTSRGVLAVPTLVKEGSANFVDKPRVLAARPFYRDTGLSEDSHLIVP